MKNYMEVVVDDILNDMLADLKICKCQQCLQDLKAIILNELPPKYIVTAKGEMFMAVADLTKQYRVDVMTAIVKAEKLVSKRPHHNA